MSCPSMEQDPASSETRGYGPGDQTAIYSHPSTLSLPSPAPTGWISAFCLHEDLLDSVAVLITPNGLDVLAFVSLIERRASLT